MIVFLFNYKMTKINIFKWDARIGFKALRIRYGYPVTMLNKIIPRHLHEIFNHTHETTHLLTIERPLTNEIVLMKILLRITETDRSTCESPYPLRMIKLGFGNCDKVDYHVCCGSSHKFKHLPFPFQHKSSKDHLIYYDNVIPSFCAY